MCHEEDRPRTRYTKRNSIYLQVARLTGSLPPPCVTTPLGQSAFHLPVRSATRASQTGQTFHRRLLFPPCGRGEKETCAATMERFLLFQQ
jgi:hypothetical protein